MPYCSRADAEFWGQFTSTSFTVSTSDSWTYQSLIERLIAFADSEIDNHCHKPKGFFNAGGVVLDNEYHNGKEVPSGNKPLFRPDYLPVIVHDQLKSVKLEYYETTAWTTKTEGSSNDYLVLDNGLILITLPDRTTYKNIRVTYRCGYVEMPSIVNTVSGRLAGAIGQLIIDANKREPTGIGPLTAGVPELASLVKVAFTPELKELLRDYRQIQIYRG